MNGLPDAAAVTDDVAAFIVEELLDGELVAHDENLLVEGRVDSLGMLRLVAFIEARYEVKVPPEDFTIEHFRTVDTIGAYLLGLMAAEG